MANRYTTLAPTTFDDIPLYQPNYEGLDLILGQQQQKYDLAGATIDALQPDALPQFQAEASAYHAQWADDIDQLPALYQKSFREGNKELNKLIRRAKREIQDPNSEFSHFANTKRKYLEGVKRIEEAHKKDPVKYNKQFAMAQLQQQLQGAKWADFYGDQGVIKNFVDPELTPYVDIQKDVVDIIGKIKLGQDTEFSKEIEAQLGRGWIEKIKTGEITPERIQQATTVLLQNPKYKDQLAVEQWYRTKDIDFEAREADYKTSLLEQRENIFNQLDNAQSLNPQELAQLQRQIGADPDGIYGVNTQQAIDDFKVQYDDNLNEQLNDPEFSQTFRNKVAQQLVQQPYIDTAVKVFANKTIDRSLIVDQPYLTRLKLANSKSNTQALVKAIGTLVPDPEVDFLTTPTNAVSLDSFDKVKSTAIETRDNANKNLDALLTNKEVRKLFSKPGLGLLGAIPQPVTKDEISNYIRTAMNIDQKDLPLEQKVNQYSAITGVPIDDARKQFNQITAGGLGRQFGDAYNASYEAGQEVDRITEVENSLINTFFANEGQGKMKDIKSKYNLDNLSNQQVVDLLNESKKYVGIKYDANGNAVGLEPILNKKGTVIGTKEVPIDRKFQDDIGKIINVKSAGYGARTVDIQTNDAARILREVKAGIDGVIKTNPEYAKSMKSFDIQGGKDTQLNSYINSLDERLNDPAQITGLIQEFSGTSTANFSDSDGNLISVNNLKNFKSTLISSPLGNRLAVSGVDKKGKVYTQDFSIPETHKERLRRANEEMGVEAYNKKDPILLEIAANNWATDNGAYGEVPMFKAAKPNEKMAKTTSFVRDISRPGETIDLTTYGTPLRYTPANGGNTFLIHMTKGSSGQPSYIATIQATDGTSSKTVMLPIKGNQGYAHDNLEFLLSEINKTEMPRYFTKEVTLERVPKGQIVPESLLNKQVAATLSTFNNIE